MLKLENITHIGKVPYVGKVYNLELESDTNSIEKEDQYFIDATTGLVTHNCFPKDVSALLAFAKKIKVPTPVISAIWKRNTTIDRTERDWEKLKGRAVSDN